MSPVAYAVTLAIWIPAVLLKDSTDGRSLGLVALAGLVILVDCLRAFRRPGVAAPRHPDQIEKPLRLIAGIVGGAALVVLGVLFAAGVLSVD